MRNLPTTDITVLSKVQRARGSCLVAMTGRRLSEHKGCGRLDGTSVELKHLTMC